MAKYRVVRGFLNLEGGNGGREIKVRGDVVELSDEEAGRSKRNLEPIDANSGASWQTASSDPLTDVVSGLEWAGTRSEAATTLTTPTTPTRDWSFIHSKTVPQVIGIIRSIQPDDLPFVRAEEQKGKGGGRAGVINAIDQRIGEIALALATSQGQELNR